MTKKQTSTDFCYDLDAMTPAEEQQFWYEFETMLYRARDTKCVSLSRINVVSSSLSQSSPDCEITLH